MKLKFFLFFIILLIIFTNSFSFASDVINNNENTSYNGLNELVPIIEAHVIKCPKDILNISELKVLLIYKNGFHEIVDGSDNRISILKNKDNENTSANFKVLVTDE